MQRRSQRHGLDAVGLHEKGKPHFGIVPRQVAHQHAHVQSDHESALAAPTAQACLGSNRFVHCFDACRLIHPARKAALSVGVSLRSGIILNPSAIGSPHVPRSTVDTKAAPARNRARLAPTADEMLGWDVLTS